MNKLPAENSTQQRQNDGRNGEDPRVLEESEATLNARSAQGLYLLQQWLLRLYQQKLADSDNNGLFLLKAEVSSRFAIGLSLANNYLVMPDDEANWAAMLPWAYAAMREENQTVYLIMDDVEIDGMATTDFGISFVISDPMKANLLRIKKILQLRRYAAQSEKITISQEWFASMPIVILKPNEGHFTKKKKKHNFTSFKTK